MPRLVATLIPGTLTVALMAATPALAQRIDDNAIADAEDAFGSSEGGEELGIYDPFNVRGFSPIDAGNVRLEGLYIDRQADLPSRLVEGNRIRVGPSAANYALPAPSGVVDYRLRTPGDEAVLSAVAQVNSFGGVLVEIDGALPLARDRFAVGGGISQSRSEYASGNNADINQMAGVARWRPEGRDTKLFWSRTRIKDEDIYPIILGNGRETPPELKRRRFLGQPWADVETERFNYGVLAQTTLAGLAVRGGLFRSVNDVREGHNVFLQAAEPGEPAARTVSAYPGRFAASTSGELGLAHGFATGGVRHRLQLVIRGREQERRYGGADREPLPFAPFGEADYVSSPAFEFGKQSADRVRQWSAGLEYQGRVDGLGQLRAGLQKLDYAKTVRTPDGAVSATKEAPWLFNVAATTDPARRFSYYASYTRGLEESDVAPETASNRDEAPPAIRTRQVDFGARVRLGGMTLIGGAFEIRRPYYGVDARDAFRRLGAVTHRGIEVSLSGSPRPGLSLVAGGTLLEARVSGEEVASGAVGNRPIDVPESKLIAGADWRPSASPTSFDVSVERVGRNVADALNQVRVAPYTVVNAGLRHRFSAMDAPAVLRLEATNLFDAYAWKVAGNNAFVYVQSRRLQARLTVDF